MQEPQEQQAEPQKKGKRWIDLKAKWEAYGVIAEALRKWLITGVSFIILCWAIVDHGIRHQLLDAIIGAGPDHHAEEVVETEEEYDYGEGEGDYNYGANQKPIRPDRLPEEKRSSTLNLILGFLSIFGIWFGFRKKKKKGV